MFTSQNIGPSGRMCLAAKRILIAISISAKPAFEVMDARHSKPRSIAFRNMLSPSDVSTCKRILVVPASALCACEPQCVYVCARHNSRWYLDSLSLSLSPSLSLAVTHTRSAAQKNAQRCADVPTSLSPHDTQPAHAGTHYIELLAALVSLQGNLSAIGFWLSSEQRKASPAAWIATFNDHQGKFSCNSVCCCAIIAAVYAMQRGTRRL